MVNILMASKWHVHATDYARVVSRQPDAKITCVWDEDPIRGKVWADELGVAFEANLHQALARSDVDAVVVDAPTSEHERVILAAANAKKHIFTEKAMAATVAECKRIEDAVTKNGVKMCISFPHLTTSLVQYCKQAIDEGWLGDLHYMRMRMAHDGASGNWLPDYWYDVSKACGGAMMDLGCHPMYAASYLLGKPTRIASMFNNSHCPPLAEDNAVSVVEFEKGVIAVLETSFISPFQAGCFELLGTKGAIVQIGQEVRVRAAKFGEGWFIPSKLPQPLPVVLRFWLDSIEKEVTAPLFAPERGTALTELLENAYKSHREQRIVTFEES